MTGDPIQFPASRRLSTIGKSPPFTKLVVLRDLYVEDLKNGRRITVAKGEIISVEEANVLSVIGLARIDGGCLARVRLRADSFDAVSADYPR